MIVSTRFDDAIVLALARIADAAAARLAAEVPADIQVARTGEGMALRGRRLGVRALTDARLRDLTGLLR